MKVELYDIAAKVQLHELRDAIIIILIISPEAKKNFWPDQREEGAKPFSLLVTERLAPFILPLLIPVRAPSSRYTQTMQE